MHKIQDVCAKLLCILALVTVYGCQSGVTQEPDNSLRLAVWNIANLHHENGVALRDSRNSGPATPDNIRSQEDYELLRKIVTEELKPDIIALQEIGSPVAAQRLFPEDEYMLVFSDRYAANNPDDLGARGDIYTAFAIRRGAVSNYTTTTRNEFSVIAADGRYTRSALELHTEFNGQDIALLNVHLKSGCWAMPLNTSAKVNDACPVIDQQVGILEDWIDTREREGVTSIVLGDFNRRIDQMAGHSTGVIAELNDDLPKGLTIYRQPFAGMTRTYRSRCWFGNWTLYNEAPIDFFLMNKKAFDLTKKGSFKLVDLAKFATERHQGRNGKRLSDHCPMIVTLESARAADPE